MTDDLAIIIKPSQEVRCWTIRSGVEKAYYWGYVDLTLQGGFILHRLNGPAIENSDGTVAWYFYGCKIECQTQDQFDRAVKLKAFL